jgi:hypothetical protein
MGRLGLFLVMTAMQTCVAVAEVCDKIDESWNTGDWPVLILPFGGWPKLLSPYFLLFFLPTIVVAAMVWRRRCPVRLALWSASFWVLVALGSFVVGLMDVDPSETVTHAAIREGCIALSWTAGVEFPIGCTLTALLLVFCWGHRKSPISLRADV